MKTTDSSFITNKSGITVQDRMESVLQPSVTKNFDILVGYFYLSGFLLISPYLHDCEKVRILVGMDADNTTKYLVNK